jgi:hypothetical protein
MTLLTREDVAQIKSLSVAKAELAQYADLLRSTLALQKGLEERIREMSGALEAEKQAAFLTKEQLEEMKRRMFGDSSERRMDPPDGPLFDGKKPEEENPEKKAEYETVQRKKRTKFGRRPQPGLPQVEIRHELSEDERKAQGLKVWEGQFEESKLITVIPTKIVMEIHQQQKYLATPDRDPTLAAVVTAPLPATPIRKLHPGDLYSLEFDIEVALAKYWWHLPLDRQVRMMESQGCAIDSQTLYSRIDKLAWYLEAAVIPRLVAEVQASPVKIGDETTWKNLAKKPEGGKNKRFYLWAVRGGRAVCFSVFDGRSGKVAKSFLNGIEGVLLVDGFKGYNCLAGPKLIIARDWVHARRKFVTAEMSEPVHAKWFIAQMKLLFDIEEKLQGRSGAEILKAREERSMPIVLGIQARQKELSAKTLPGSALGKALGYLQTYWEGLTVFLKHAEVPLHSNDIESAIRGPVVGRKNHAGSKSLATGRVAAIFYSIIETCKWNDVDCRRYLYQAMQAILTKKPVPMPWDLAKPEKAVSITVVSEMTGGLTQKPPEIGPRAVSQSVS